MAGAWEPELRVHETGDGCRLTLVGVTYGDGATLTEAADALVARLLTIVHGVRSSGLRMPLSMGPVDTRLPALLWELDEMVRRGEDIRPRVLGFVDTGDVAEDDVADDASPDDTHA
jgi:hypothetical protein